MELAACYTVTLAENCITKRNLLVDSIGGLGKSLNITWILDFRKTHHTFKSFSQK